MRLQLAALGCVLLLAVGQIAFKAAAEASVSAGGLLAPRPIAIAIGAFAIYGIASILWMLLLQRAPISRVYPLMGLAFMSSGTGHDEAADAAGLDTRTGRAPRTDVGP